uniref:SF3 helicase domain-containing protein n=1 Tax=Caulerpa ashmeadii TaxID=177078 RepID=A0A6B9VWM4_9CHLO|nr:hypothetical protein, primase [Caulerpa ashmeadii]QHQ73297.1 hypothetical protein, primase [Caulerpa ashmeadii]QHQ73337.1 hypothetical protein [Caulerpa ashmeadii]
MVGDSGIISIIFCFASAILQNFDLDRFLFFIGPSNSGKSTGIQFFDSLFMPNSVITKTFSEFSSQFGLADIPEKEPRIIVIRDSESKASEKATAILKSLVSNGEPVAIQRKFMTSVDYIFKGGVIIASNYSTIFQRTGRGVLEKRMIPIEFNKIIPPDSQKEIGELFPKNELGFFIALALRFDKRFVLNTLRMAHRTEIVGDNQALLTESSIHTSVLQFIEKSLLRKEGAFVFSGFTSKERRGDLKSIAGEYEKYLEIYNPNQTVEAAANLRDKFQTVLNYLGWTTTQPIVSPDRGRIKVNLNNGKSIQRRGYKNLAWKNEGDQPQEYDQSQEDDQPQSGTSVTGVTVGTSQSHSGTVGMSQEYGEENPKYIGITL